MNTSTKEFDLILKKIEPLLKKLPVKKRFEYYCKIKERFQQNKESFSQEMQHIIKQLEKIKKEKRSKSFVKLSSFDLFKIKIKENKLKTGFILITGFFLLSIYFLFFYQWPNVIGTQKKNNMNLLGGLINVKIKGSPFTVPSLPTSKVSGKYSLSPSSKKIIHINFPQGELALTSHIDSWSFIFWECNNHSDFHPPQRSHDSKQNSIDFAEDKEQQCHIQVPKNTRIKLSMNKGKLKLIRPQYSLESHIDEAIIKISPHIKASYDYQLNAINGHVDDFPSTSQKKAYKIQIQLLNGQILYDTK